MYMYVHMFMTTYMYVRTYFSFWIALSSCILPLPTYSCMNESSLSMAIGPHTCIPKYVYRPLKAIVFISSIHYTQSHLNHPIPQYLQYLHCTLGSWAIASQLRKEKKYTNSITKMCILDSTLWDSPHYTLGHLKVAKVHLRTFLTHT